MGSPVKLQPGSLKGDVLALFRTAPGHEAHVREVARSLGRPAASVGRVLAELENSGQLSSRWVGRSRVYRLARERKLSTEPDAEARPYFLWDVDVSWSEFRAMLQSPDVATRRYAMERLLDGARWKDIWTLVTPAQVRAELPHLHTRFHEVYAEALRARGA